MTVPSAPDSQVRLFIGPVNYAGQGFAWARAAERHLTSVGAVSMAYTGIGEFGFPIDQAVPATGYVLSSQWQRRQFHAVSGGFTHVLIEAERNLFGRVFDQTVVHQAHALIEAGVSVAMLAHGTDLRLPSRHAATEEFSPFREGEWDQTSGLEQEAQRNRRMLDELGLPVYVSTLGLLADAPDGAQWLPVVVDPEVWKPGTEAGRRDVPVVVHAPSRGVVKGSDLIEPVMQQLHDQGVVEYRRISGVPAHEMPEIYRGADIVLDQFRLGDYGVAACEAMLAGRVVVGHVSSAVREQVRLRTDLDLPIVEATPDSLESVLLGLCANPDRLSQVGAAGHSFASAVHDGRLSAAALEPFLRQGESARV
ncbi:hypothetical protein [Leucobacter sp. 1207-22]|uniref:hypothetical protein n=1 Tax=Leucobacter sp. 1207-22 TaxID=2604456 RepID=UPI00406285CA